MTSACKLTVLISMDAPLASSSSFSNPRSIKDDNVHKTLGHCPSTFNSGVDDKAKCQLRHAEVGRSRRPIGVLPETVRLLLILSVQAPVLSDPNLCGTPATLLLEAAKRGEDFHVRRLR